MQTDTVEQTIEKLMSTVNKLEMLAHKAIDFVESDERMALRENLLDIIWKHNEQY